MKKLKCEGIFGGQCTLAYNAIQCCTVDWGEVRGGGPGVQCAAAWCHTDMVA